MPQECPKGGSVACTLTGLSIDPGSAQETDRKLGGYSTACPLRRSERTLWIVRLQ